MEAQQLSRTLADQFRYTAFAFEANLADLSDDDALRPPGTAGNTLNWVAGHVVHARAGILELLDAAPPFAAADYEIYKRGSGPAVDPGDAVPLSRMRLDFAGTAELLRAGLACLTDEAAAAPAPFSPTDDPEETVGSLLAGLAFHEAYHVGQLGVLRRLAGSAGAIP